MARWPDVQKLGVTALAAATQKRAATRTPANLAEIVAADGGFTRVTRGPGTDDGITDSPLLDVESFAPTEKAAWDLAEDSRQAIHALRGKKVGDALVDSVSTASGPVLIDWGNPAVVRFVASYRLALRQR